MMGMGPTEWLTMIGFFAACAVANRWAFRKDVQRLAQWYREGGR